MNRKLPKIGTPEWEAEVAFYTTSTNNERIERAKKLGFAGTQSYCSAMNGRNIHLNNIIPAIETSEPIGLSTEEDHIIRIIKGSDVPVTVSELSRQLDRSSETIIKLVDTLRSKGYEVILDEASHSVNIPVEPGKDFQPTDFKYHRKEYTIGHVSDTHMCSIYQQVTLLYDLYKMFDDRKVDFITHAGDVVDGRKMFRGHEDLIFKHTAKDQEKYVIDNYPTSTTGAKTYMIGGQHDYSHYKDRGYNIFDEITKKRKDIVYRGFFAADFRVKGVPIALRHPGGGVSYARSYRLQKIVENLAGYVMAMVRQYPEKLSMLPAVLLAGHFHVTAHLPLYMGIEVASLPCLQAQTPYLAEKGYMPNIGGAILNMAMDKDNNLTSVKLEFIHMNSRVIAHDY